MGHNPATRESTKAVRPAAVETRTPEEIIKTIRGNLKSPVTILKSDIQVLMDAYDALIVDQSITTARLLARAEDAEATVAELERTAAQAPADGEVFDSIGE
jgi:hypothetical protein